MTFKVNDRIYYVSGRHGAFRSNPLKGSEHECQGTIVSTKGSIEVHWDNNAFNSYIPDDLCHVDGDDTIGPNMAFRIKKLGKRR